eukprot:2898907-Amphidinium_carterae.1
MAPMVDLCLKPYGLCKVSFGQLVWSLEAKGSVFTASQVSGSSPARGVAPCTLTKSICQHEKPRLGGGCAQVQPVERGSTSTLLSGRE